MKGTSYQKKRKGVSDSFDTLELWAPMFTAVELEKQVTSTETSKDHETCVALGSAIMLSQDVANLAAEDLE